MITNIYLICLTIIGTTAIEWMRIGKKRGPSRWILLGAMGLTAGIWLYLTLGEPLFHPIMELSEWMDPISPKAYP
ncbi:hypothetical protein MO973_15385 [Paenibacillus sp. TRM 82003]|nr:hypothetical protein [Paenibacillus sp. TRM 82003]